MKESYTNPDDKGLSLYWYAIETKAVAGYQLTVRSHVITVDNLNDFSTPKRRIQALGWRRLTRVLMGTEERKETLWL